MTTESTAGQTLKAHDVRYFWIDGGPADEDRSYHYDRDCAWLAVDLWHGGRLVTSDAPPPGAADTSWLWRDLADLKLQPEWQPGVVRAPNDETAPERWLCRVCRMYMPIPKAVPRPADEEPCEKCLCPRRVHLRWRSMFDRGCAVAWADSDFDEDGNVIQTAMRHCPCDGYEPPAGGRPLTPVDFAAAALDVPTTTEVVP